MFEELTVETGNTASAWTDLAAAYKALNNEKESGTMTLAQLRWPEAFDQASAKLEFADDTLGTNPGALYDTDGSTLLSNITKPAIGQRTSLSPAKFAMVKCVRIVLPGAASQDWTFGVGMRKAV